MVSSPRVLTSDKITHIAYLHAVQSSPHVIVATGIELTRHLVRLSKVYLSVR